MTQIPEFWSPKSPPHLMDRWNLEWGGGLLAGQAPSQPLRWGRRPIPETSGWFSSTSILDHHWFSPYNLFHRAWVVLGIGCLVRVKTNNNNINCDIMNTPQRWPIIIYLLIRSEARVRATFRNPLKEELTHCYFLFEASGVVRSISMN